MSLFVHANFIVLPIHNMVSHMNFPEVVKIVLPALLSFLAALFLAYRKTNADIKNLKLELLYDYSRALFEKRVEHYPSLYSICSKFGKLIYYGQHSVAALIEFRDQLDDWNNRHAIFFSRTTSRISYRFRSYLSLLLAEGEKTEIGDSDWHDIDAITEAFELSLRADIGAFDTEPAGKLADIHKVYERIDSRINSFKKRLKLS
jgi:hypothetical protein